MSAKLNWSALSAVEQQVRLANIAAAIATRLPANQQEVAYSAILKSLRGQVAPIIKPILPGTSHTSPTLL